MSASVDHGDFSEVAAWNEHFIQVPIGSSVFSDLNDALSLCYEEEMVPGEVLADDEFLRRHDKSAYLADQQFDEVGVSTEVHHLLLRGKFVFDH